MSYKVKFKDITINLDKRRKPLNGASREKISIKKLYPYCGANSIMDYVDEYLFDEEILCIAEDGGKWGKNEVCSYIMNEKCWVNNHAHVIKVKENVDIRYLKHWLNYSNLNSYITGAIVRKLTQKELNELEIFLPDKSEQIRTSDVIDKCQEIIYIRKKQIEQLDELIKSQFVEMFGTPFNNDKWEIKKLGDIANSITDGSNVDTKYYKGSGEVLFLRIQNVWRNEFRLEDSVYISKEVNKKYLDTSLHTGDLLISKIGRYYTKDSSLGRVSIYRGENDMANYSNNVMRIRLKPEYNSEFINIVLNLDDYQQHIRRESKGGTDKRALSKKVIENFPIINPPIEIQIKYIEFVKLIDKQKFEIQKSLEEIQKLQESLMNKYFG